MKILLKPTKLYKRVSLFVVIIVGVLIGNYIFGPPLRFGILDWYNSQNQLVKDLIGVDSMIFNSLISASVPMFAVWAFSFYSYKSLKNNLEILNSNLPIVMVFVENPASIFIFIVSIFLGICVDGWANYGYSEGLLMLTIYSLIIFGMGFVLRYMSTPRLNESKLLDRYSRYLGHFCITLTFTAYLWTVFASPLEMYLLLKNNAIISQYMNIKHICSI